MLSQAVVDRVLHEDALEDDYDLGTIRYGSIIASMSDSGATYHGNP